MEFERLKEIIESNEFDAHMSISSGWKLTLKLFSNYFGEAKKSPHEEKLIDRVYEILDLGFNREYRNPFDMALAGYLYVLYLSCPERAVPVAMDILSESHLWSASEMAGHILIWQDIVPENHWGDSSVYVGRRNN